MYPVNNASYVRAYPIASKVGMLRVADTASDGAKRVWLRR